MAFAHVDSVDALKHLKVSLWKFVETANQSLSEADADLQRVLNWLEHDAPIDWQGRIKKRTLSLNQAKESLRAKLAVTRRDGTKPSAIEEQKAVSRAKDRLDQALNKLETVKKYAKAFQREALQYRGLMQRFVNAVQIEIPAAAGHLDGLIGSLSAYTAHEEVGSVAADRDHAVSQAGAESPGQSMKRALDEPEKHDPVSDASSQATASNPARRPQEH